MSDVNNPFETPRADVGTGAPPAVEVTADVSRVAVQHRRLNLLVLANIGVYATLIGLAVTIPDASEAIAGLLGLVMLALGLALVITFFRLTAALEWSVLSRVLCGLGMFIGLLNLLILISAISAANRRLREVGLKVGLLGVSPADLVTWRRQHGLPGHE